MTKPEAGSLDRNRGCFSFLFRFLKVGAVLVSLGVAWIMLTTVAERLKCGVLPNGATIEFSTFFIRSPIADWPPTMTLRDADGRVLITTNRGVRFHRVPSDASQVILRYGKQHGNEMQMDGRDFMETIYDKESFGNEWNKPRKITPHDTSIILTDLFTIHYGLRYRDRYSRLWCRSIWFSQ